MKKALLTLIAGTFALLAHAQLGYNYAQYDFGISGFSNTAYTDAEIQKHTGALGLNFTYNQTPFINFVAEFQVGRLSGGDAINTLSGRQFQNNYTSLAFRGQLQAGEFYDYSNSMFGNAFKNLYVGSGVGLNANHMAYINRNSLYVPDFTSTGLNDSQEIYIPVRIGYELKVFNSYNEPTFKVDIGYQHNFILGDQLDGIKAGMYNDSFGQFFIGLKFSVGGVTSYRKQINY
ncbi:hypothetical protein [Mucilaginibacter sp.]